ncbi:hypothetical protein [Planococcus halotolerans]|uniref:Intracellular proteinase inhibitor BsuPI domain-containing protein n=1 Tax=Planococcus halotolerans TaxID=2233542 RepID=A0A365KXH9_9BACL|nr:hypothetical protein [Planococcus halotolerans]QHJ72096.1 hypothetical protein DNR44_016480 [Planococcus halotolerans]RAZ77888.1 hypothetical protein DP120_10450 [Planococcus halotolerans]
MKKLYIILFILLIGAVLSACSDEAETAGTDEEAAIIQVTNSSDRQITSIELKLYQNDMVQASPTVMNADESLIVMGEAVDFEILTQDIDFNEPVVIEAVAMIDGVEVSAGTTEPMELSQGEYYAFELARDPELQFREIQED